MIYHVDDHVVNLAAVFGENRFEHVPHRFARLRLHADRLSVRQVQSEEDSVLQPNFFGCQHRYVFGQIERLSNENERTL